MKRNRGITLIALVVTIIVLIILAGVSVNLVLGQNGIITKAKEAKKNHEKEAVKEKVSLMMGEYATEREENNKTLNDYLENQEKAGNIESIEQGEENEEGTQTIIVDDYRVVIDEETLEILEIEKAGPKPKITNIKITYIDTTDGTEKEATEKSVEEGTPLKITFDVSFEEGTIEGVNIGSFVNRKVEYTTNGTEKEVSFVVTGVINGEKVEKRQKVSIEKYYQKAEVEASDIANNASKYYGQLVTNYTCPSTAVEAWRIFYADENNIYLIADNYITPSDMPLSPSGYAMVKGVAQRDPSEQFANVIKDLTYNEGTTWIYENSKARDWISEYSENNVGISTRAAKSMAYLMDTNIWSDYYAGNEAEYAIGCATLELYCSSYQDTHPDKYIVFEGSSTGGYKAKWNTSSNYTSYVTSLDAGNNNIYFTSGSSCFICSNSDSTDYRLLDVNGQGSLGYSNANVWVPRASTYCLFK